MRNNIRLILIYVLFFQVSIMYSQEMTITGTVTNEEEMTLPGVNIVVKGTFTCLQTDFDGNYSITVDEGAILVFSFIGPKKLGYPVGNNILLKQFDDPRLNVFFTSIDGQFIGAEYGSSTGLFFSFQRRWAS